MCGIAGIVHRRADLGVPSVDGLLRMAGSLRHRGPDEYGVYRDHRAGLAHSRLSIIDLETGQQPQSNEDGSWWIVFNGEIFNYIELREQLVALGHRFRTRSDTEVIVHAYEEWGDLAFRRFNGQWALALWNEKTSTLVLSRDAYGICPLYVMEHDGALYFASEVRAIFAADVSLPRRLDATGLDQLFTTWTTVAPRSIFEGVEEVEPGTVRTYVPDSVRRTRVWSPAYPGEGQQGFTGSVDEAAEAVRAALEHAAAFRVLRADVPVASYLSGGLDSSLVAALGLRAKGSKFLTFSLRFEDSEYDETAHQRAMASHLGSDHHDIVVSRADIARTFPDVILHTERPVLRTAAAPLFLLSGLVRRAGIKVVLTGEGADEMFAGYDLFKEAKVRRFWARQPESAWRPRLLERLYPYLERSPVKQRAIARQFFGHRLDQAAAPGFGHFPRWYATAALRRLFSKDFVSRPDDQSIIELIAELPADFKQWTPLAQDQFLEIHTLLSGYLLSSQGDRMLMAHSVEGRFPFLDPAVTVLADSLPPLYKLHRLDEKHVLKRLARGLVPESIRTRSKQPYRAPDALALAAPEAIEWIEEVASERALADAGVFAPAAARQLIQKCRARAEDGQFSNADNMGLVGVLSTQLVHHHFIQHQPTGTPPSLVRTVVDRVAETMSRS
jgi:asparagine synthase (glutamine-hydrolysing)